jgi:GT2 family glycosyltransferase
MTAPLSVTAIFATMNRAPTAVACVLALARQTRPPDRVVVADNVSKDGTVAALEILTDLPFELKVHRMAENLGNAGGVREVMEMAFSEGADAVWILDDDSWPRERALEFLLQQEWDPRVVRHALQVDPKTGRFTWPLLVASGKAGWQMVWDEKELPDGDLLKSKSSWTGALISQEVHERTGAVNGDLFIRGEDEEYPWRIAREGFSFEAVRAAVLDHPGPEDLVHWKSAGKNFFFERGLADWKLYYKVRNMVWLKRKQSGPLKAAGMAVAYSLAAIILDGPKRLPLLLRAIRDGWSGKLGKMEGNPT